MNNKLLIKHDIDGHRTIGVLCGNALNRFDCECGLRLTRDPSDKDAGKIWDDAAEHQHDVLTGRWNPPEHFIDPAKGMIKGGYANPLKDPYPGRRMQPHKLVDLKEDAAGVRAVTLKPVDKSPKTVVELVDSATGHTCHKTMTVHINGSPVRVLADSLEIGFGFNETTTVQLTLLVDELHFRARREDEENV